jgi:predicted ferric reductase
VGPFGPLTLRKNAARLAVFLADSIGVTPFRSILWQAVEQELLHHLFLFYPNCRSEDATFLEEMDRENPNYTSIGTTTEVGESNRVWRGETGFINQEMLAKYIGGLLDLCFPYTDSQTGESR